MSPFNLEEALTGKLCVTRNGRKVRLIFDKSEIDPNTDFPLIGYTYETYGWTNDIDEWGKNGNYLSHVQSNSDLVGMWDEPQSEITITIPTPLKEAKDEQEVWFLGYDVYNIKGDNAILVKELFSTKNRFHDYLLDTGQLFATKEDANAFLSALKGARK